MEVVGQARGYHLEPLIEPGLIPSVSSDSASADSPVTEAEAQTDTATAEESPSSDTPPDTATAPVALRDAAIPGPEALRPTSWIASPWLRDEEAVSLLKADLA
jgi:hypothetical protein